MCARWCAAKYIGKSGSNHNEQSQTPDQKYNTYIMRSFAALIAVFGVATAQEPPSIAADGTELVFNWGASKSISIQDLVDRLEACETGLRAQSKSISSINDADVDCTASNDIVVGKMALTDVLRLTISIEGCKSKAASSFSVSVVHPMAPQ